MHVRWKVKTLTSNRLTGEPTCPHRSKKPVTYTPVMMLVQGQKQTYAWRVGPGIRGCCLNHGLAQAAWWWEVDQRFKDLAESGIEDNKELSRAILSAKRFILSLLEERVPRPTKEAKREYREFRKLHRKPRKVTIRLPSFAKTLGITWPCSPEDLKATWRKLALQHHPDRGGRPEEFIRIKAAYDQACGRIS
jgi:hypothetical protein